MRRWRRRASTDPVFPSIADPFDGAGQDADAPGKSVGKRVVEPWERLITHNNVSAHASALSLTGLCHFFRFPPLPNHTVKRHVVRWKSTLAQRPVGVRACGRDPCAR